MLEKNKLTSDDLFNSSGWVRISQFTTEEREKIESLIQPQDSLRFDSFMEGLLIACNEMLEDFERQISSDKMITPKKAQKQIDDLCKLCADLTSQYEYMNPIVQEVIIDALQDDPKTLGLENELNTIINKLKLLEYKLADIQFEIVKGKENRYARPFIKKLYNLLEMVIGSQPVRKFNDGKEMGMLNCLAEMLLVDILVKYDNRLSNNQLSKYGGTLCDGIIKDMIASSHIL